MDIGGGRGDCGSHALGTLAVQAGPQSSSCTLAAQGWLVPHPRCGWGPLTLSSVSYEHWEDCHRDSEMIAMPNRQLRTPTRPDSSW